MRDYETDLTQSKLKEILHYNPDTGIFTSKVDRGVIRTGQVIGVKRYFSKGCKHLTGSKHCITANIKNFRYKCHRLAFLYMTGTWPKGVVDHDDRNPFNNKWDNLNDTTDPINKKNRTLQTNNTSGVNGVGWAKHANKWYARIKLNGKLKHLGYFKRFDDAVEERKAADKIYKFHKNHGTSLT